MTATGPSRSVELAQHSAIELILTSILLFGVTTIVRFVVGPSAISRAFPQIHVELLIVGLGVGVLLTGLIKSPLGKISGGHTNPAISLAMYLVCFLQPEYSLMRARNFSAQYLAWLPHGRFGEDSWNSRRCCTPSFSPLPAGQRRRCFLPRPPAWVSSSSQSDTSSLSRGSLPWCLGLLGFWSGSALRCSAHKRAAA